MVKKKYIATKKEVEPDFFLAENKGEIPPSPLTPC